MPTLSPQSSHMMHSLYATFFGPFKTYYSQAFDNWMINHPGRAITEQQIGGLVNHAFEKAATVSIARKGFKGAGIWPFNWHIVSATDLAPSLTSEQSPTSTALP
jgi:hypothetical protein